MKNPDKDLNRLFPARNKKFSRAVSYDERTSQALDYFTSDFHDRDITTMAEVYGSDFRKVRKKTRKKWWA